MSGDIGEGNVLVTGANGFIGRALCRRLPAEGWKVRGAVRSQVGRVLLSSGVEAVSIGSIGSDTEWGEALVGIDTVVHLAARVHVMDDTSYPFQLKAVLGKSGN